MLAKIYSAANLGLLCDIVEVEVDLARGLPGFSLVGLGDAAVQESKERVRSAIKNSGFDFPQSRITVNLAPADMRKFGPAFDLPIALGLLIASDQLKNPPNLTRTLFLGELSLEGSIRPVTGVLPLALEAKKQGFTTLFLPAKNASEASAVEGITIYPLATLSAAVDHLTGSASIIPTPPLDLKAFTTRCAPAVDFAHIRGNEAGKRALTIAAAGGHNLLFLGPPGSGKTMLAKALLGILPSMTTEEILEVTALYSIAGKLGTHSLITSRPFRSAHHTASSTAIVGGGTKPMPGEISLAHRGVLFLDELAEFPSNVLETLRQPLEEGTITISRALGNATFPARCMLVAAMNPPGSTLEDPEGLHADSSVRARFAKRISGPLMDRIDLSLTIPRQSFEKLTEHTPQEHSSAVQQRVQSARNRMAQRYAPLGITANAELTSEQTKTFCRLPKEAELLASRAMDQFSLSGRAYFRLLKVARTIADLADSEDIQTPHLAEALQYRMRSFE